MSWICEESKYKHENIPKDLLKQIEEKVKKDLETEMQE